MREFEKLVHVLERELGYQEKLLTLLASERAAIVHLNNEDLNTIREQKEKIFFDAMKLGQRRAQILSDLGREEDKLPVIIEECPSPKVKAELDSVRTDLKKTTAKVREFSDSNAKLIKQSLGLIASTISIMRGFGSATSVNTYGATGALRGKEKTNPLGVDRTPGAGVTREA
jgi:flagellar biosynthesis/type III secretory pathway chaperone